ncbi:hypothetical protein SAMN04487974_10843 [Pelagibacterium luteolum]|uniref:Uncharacterized protein n=1 Tax=Pelagibacterium luteolum TaxID=440168 RepID=A0A1G7X1C3_9HYPH|nr:hypothetical protein SAMN04487974_10843 [Pelagibacterium luteolum]
MAGGPCSTTHDDTVTEHGRTTQTTHARNDAIAPDTAIVPDLDKIIDLAPLADDGIAKRTSIDRGVRANLHAILDDHAPKLWNFAMPVSAQLKSKAFGTNDDAGLNNHIIAQMCAGDRCVRADHTIAPDRYPCPDRDIRPQDCARTNLRPVPYRNVRRDNGTRLDKRRVMHFSGCGQTRIVGIKHLEQIDEDVVRLLACDAHLIVPVVASQIGNNKDNSGSTGVQSVSIGSTTGKRNAALGGIGEITCAFNDRIIRQFKSQRLMASPAQ